MSKFNPNSKWPVHPRDRFSDADLGLAEADTAEFDGLILDERNRVIGESLPMLLHGHPEGIYRVAAIDNLHVLASKLGMEIVPVERIDG